MARKVYQLTEAAPRVAYEIPYDELLNEEQRAVVFAGGGPLLVLAGAGSGKTRTLTYRVARLIESGVSPDRILLLTFTNKAAREMMGRVASLLGEVPKGMWGGTFHHVGNQILRRHADKLGYPKRFNIMDSEDARTLMSLAIAEAGVDTRERRFPRANVLSRLYSLAVNTGEAFDDLVVRRAPHLSRQLDEVLAVFRKYAERKVQLGVMDYDDLLLNWARLFQENEPIWSMYADRFEHVLVDEYQDTNHVQGGLIDHCARAHGNLTVVGDDCQSIFRFRGADYSNILEFPKRHADTQIFKLQTNYRSSPQILSLANASIRLNRMQFQKRLRSVQPEDEKPAVVPCRDVAQQAQFVAQRVLEIGDEDVPLGEVAVLYRAHYQSMELQVELSKRGIPFVVRSGVRFFEQAHIKDVLSFLRLVFNPRDRLAYERIVRTADGIGKKLGQRIWEQVNRFDDPREGWAADGVADGLPKRARRSWDRVRRTLLELERDAESGSPAEAIDRVLEGGYRAYLRRSYENAEARGIDIEQLGNFAAQHETVEAFLSEISLQTNIEAEDVVEPGSLDESLVLSTIHQAKGLEFRAVFVIWLAEGRFPSARSEAEDGLDEERRLFYVATTRAKSELYLCFPIAVHERDRGLTLVRRSPFIEELDPDLFDEWVLAR